DLQPVLDALTQRAVAACGATDAVLYAMLSGERVAGAHDGPLGYEPPTLTFGQLLTSGRGAVAVAALPDPQPLHLPDDDAAGGGRRRAVPGASAASAHGGRARPALDAPAARPGRHRHARPAPRRGRPLHGPPDRALGGVRPSGGDRPRERPPVRRAAGPPGAA